MRFVTFIGENFLLVQNNARPRIGGEVKDYPNDIPFMQWPPRSPDHNTMEHITWDAFKRSVKCHKSASQTSENSKLLSCIM